MQLRLFGLIGLLRSLNAAAQSTNPIIYDVGTIDPLSGCHEMCKSCHLFDHDKLWHCLECQTGYTLWVDACMAPCPVGYFRWGYECRPCANNCDECVGELPDECVKCSTSYVLDNRGLCVKTCRDGEYANFVTDSCEPCQSASLCATCVSPYRISCKSCFVGYELRIVDIRTQTGECLRTCPKGFYRDTPDDLRCIACSTNCDECTSASQCLVCSPGYYLWYGYCYEVPVGGAETIDFESYLASGAGVSWNQQDAPSWSGNIR